MNSFYKCFQFVQLIGYVKQFFSFISIHYESNGACMNNLLRGFNIKWL